MYIIYCVDVTSLGRVNGTELLQETDLILRSYMLQLLGMSVTKSSLAKACVCESVSVCARMCNLDESRCRVCIVHILGLNIFKRKLWEGKF